MDDAIRSMRVNSSNPLHIPVYVEPPVTTDYNNEKVKFVKK